MTTILERQVRRSGTAVAHATVVDDGDQWWISISVAGGPIPSSVRREIVEQALDVPDRDGPKRAHVTIPLGDPELMAALGRHLSGMRTRASGCTCLVDGTVNGTDR